MTNRICHLCGTYYNDDPYLQAQLAHTRQECLETLQFQVNQARLHLQEVEGNLKHAEKSREADK